MSTRTAVEAGVSNLASAIVEGLKASTESKKSGSKRVSTDKDNREITTVIERSADVQTIIVPKDMDLLDASRELKAQYDNEEQVIDMVYALDGWEWQDALYAIKCVSEYMFGWINGKTIKTPWGDVRPKEIDVVTDIKNNDKVIAKCFFGKFGIAAWEDALADVSVGAKGAVISIKGKKKYSDLASMYFKAIEQFLRDHSIYRGKTVVITSSHNRAAFDIMENKKADHIVLNAEEKMVIEDFVLTDLGTPGKRVYLFTGGYGNGKTETAMAIGREGNNLYMPMFYLKDATLFDEVLNLCKNYQPCILFVEDIDEIGSGEQRDQKMNKILNTIDGIQTKGNDLTVIFTTNNEKRINSALRRPGRIDQMIRFTNPTTATKVAIMKQYFDGIVGCGGLDFDTLANNMGDVSASVVAQICKRTTKLAAKKGSISDNVVTSATISMDYQVKLMQEPVEARPVEQVFTENLRNVLFTKEVLNKIVDAIND